MAQLKRHLEVAGTSWLGSIPEKSERIDGQDHLDHYTGDHKKRSFEVCGKEYEPACMDLSGVFGALAELTVVA